MVLSWVLILTLPSPLNQSRSLGKWLSLKSPSATVPFKSNSPNNSITTNYGKLLITRVLLFLKI